MRKSKLDSIIQLLIPPSLVLLLIVTIIDLFYEIGIITSVLIDIFDIYVIIIFAIDLYFRWFETPKLIPYIKKHFLDIIATIPFNLIFLGIQGLTLVRALRGIRLISRFSKFARFARFTKYIRLVRFSARSPRFLRIRKHVKKTKIRKVQPHEKSLKKTLSFKVILLITINSIMGTGIWFLTSAGAKHAGPASLISWGVLSLISVYIAMCFSELTSMFPKAGGVYEFGKQAYGRFWSFVIGWTTSIAGSVTIAMLLLGSLQYLIPVQYSFTYVPIAILLIILFSCVAFRGMQTSTVVLVTFSIITLTAVISIIIPGVINFNPENFDPFFVMPTMSILLAIFFIAETFFGWESAIFLSAETKNPSKVMPKALIYGTLVIAILSFFLAFTAMGSIPWAEYASSIAPLRDLGNVHFGNIGGLIFSILIFVSVIGATAGWIVTAPRLLMSIAEDKLFFSQFAKIHPKHKSPYISIIFQALVVSILVIIGAGSYETLLHMLIPLILLVYSAVLLSVVILRFKRPNLKRPYKVIFGKIGPLFTVLFMIFLLIMFIRETHGAWDILRISGGLIAFGIPAYFAIELFYDQKYVILRRNLVANLLHHYHKLPLPKISFNRVISYVKPFNKKKTLMVFNSSMGEFTQTIINKKILFKQIYLANQSKEEIKIFKENISPKNRSHVDIHLIRSIKIPNKVKNINAFVSFNDLGYVKDMFKFVNDVNNILSKKGKFCFYIKSHILNVTPNAVDVEDKKKMLKLFKDAGLKANYKIKKSLFKTEIFISGKKSSGF
ncbi:amino acid permease [archaeon]|jgi:basic amino acid/polyamine antiporter, APA family|nr:amino acid permease [archaeon]MBT3450819.1 amino acid permease [archaeon]MBT6868472.1 amino acid permease [archaeon]MBT7193571.1 amino acid permease [archaeon]MBT7381234.1 amino acid permease [archaeon]